jgi:hypothetical protein
MSAFRRAQHLKSHHLFAGRLRAQRTVDLAGGVGTLIKRSPQAGVGAANRSVDLVCTRSKWQLRWRPVARTRELGSRMGLAEIEPFCRNSETVLARYSRDHTNNRRLENYPLLTSRVEIKKSNLYAVATRAVLRRSSNIAAVWWKASRSVPSTVTRSSRRGCPSRRQQKDSSNSRAVGSRKLSINGLLGTARGIGFPRRVAKWHTTRTSVRPAMQVFIGVSVKEWMIGRESRDVYRVAHTSQVCIRKTFGL